MAETALAMLSRYAPVFDSVDQDVRLAFLQDAADEESVTFWGDLYARACVLRAAHLLELRRRSAAGMVASGPVTQESVGQVSVSYGWSGLYGDLARTSYGLQLIELSKRVPAGTWLVDSRTATPVED